MQMNTCKHAHSTYWTYCQTNHITIWSRCGHRNGYECTHTLDWFQPKISTFLRALSFYGFTKWTRKYLSSVQIVFKNQIPQYEIYSLNFCTGLFLFIYLSFIVPLQKAFLFQLFCFLIFSKNLIFRFYISKELTICRKISMQTLK